MGRIQEVGWVTAGLVIWAGTCYYIYRLTKGRSKKVRRLPRNESRLKKKTVVGVRNQTLATAGAEIKTKSKIEIGAEMGARDGTRAEVAPTTARAGPKACFQSKTMTEIENKAETEYQPEAKVIVGTVVKTEALTLSRNKAKVREISKKTITQMKAESEKIGKKEAVAQTKAEAWALAARAEANNEVMTQIKAEAPTLVIKETEIKRVMVAKMGAVNKTVAAFEINAKSMEDTGTVAKTSSETSPGAGVCAKGHSNVKSSIVTGVGMKTCAQSQAVHKIQVEDIPSARTEARKNYKTTPRTGSVADMKASIQPPNVAKAQAVGMPAAEVVAENCTMIMCKTDTETNVTTHKQPQIVIKKQTEAMSGAGKGNTNVISETIDMNFAVQPQAVAGTQAEAMPDTRVKTRGKHKATSKAGARVNLRNNIQSETLPNVRVKSRDNLGAMEETEIDILSCTQPLPVANVQTDALSDGRIEVGANNNSISKEGSGVDINAKLQATSPNQVDTLSSAKHKPRGKGNAKCKVKVGLDMKTLAQLPAGNKIHTEPPFDSKVDTKGDSNAISKTGAKTETLPVDKNKSTGNPNAVPKVEAGTDTRDLVQPLSVASTQVEALPGGKNKGKYKCNSISKAETGADTKDSVHLQTVVNPQVEALPIGKNKAKGKRNAASKTEVGAETKDSIQPLTVAGTQVEALPDGRNKAKVKCNAVSKAEAVAEARVSAHPQTVDNSQVEALSGGKNKAKGKHNAASKVEVGTDTKDSAQTQTVMSTQVEVLSSGKNKAKNNHNATRKKEARADTGDFAQLQTVAISQVEGGPCDKNKAKDNSNAVFKAEVNKDKDSAQPLTAASSQVEDSTHTRDKNRSNISAASKAEAGTDTGGSGQSQTSAISHANDLTGARNKVRDNSNVSSKVGTEDLAQPQTVASSQAKPLPGAKDMTMLRFGAEGTEDIDVYTDPDAEAIPASESEAHKQTQPKVHHYYWDEIGVEDWIAAERWIKFRFQARDGYWENSMSWAGDENEGKNESWSGTNNKAGTGINRLWDMTCDERSIKSWPRTGDQISEVSWVTGNRAIGESWSGTKNQPSRVSWTGGQTNGGPWAGPEDLPVGKFKSKLEDQANGGSSWIGSDDQVSGGHKLELADLSRGSSWPDIRNHAIGTSWIGTEDQAGDCSKYVFEDQAVGGVPWAGSGHGNEASRRSKLRPEDKASEGCWPRAEDQADEGSRLVLEDQYNGWICLCSGNQASRSWIGTGDQTSGGLGPEREDQFSNGSWTGPGIQVSRGSWTGGGSQVNVGSRLGSDDQSRGVAWPATGTQVSEDFLVGAQADSSKPGFEEQGFGRGSWAMSSPGNEASGGLKLGLEDQAIGRSLSEARDQSSGESWAYRGDQAGGQSNIGPSDQFNSECWIETVNQADNCSKLGFENRASGDGSWAVSGPVVRPKTWTQAKDQASGESQAMAEVEASKESWFEAGNETSLGSWFWDEEEADIVFSSGSEGECRSRPREETIISSSFGAEDKVRNGSWKQFDDADYMGSCAGAEARMESWFWNGNATTKGSSLEAEGEPDLGCWTSARDANEGERSKRSSPDIEEISLRSLFWPESEDSTEFRSKTEKHVKFECEAEVKAKAQIKNELQAANEVSEISLLPDVNRSPDKSVPKSQANVSTESRDTYSSMVSGSGVGSWAGAMIWTKMKFPYPSEFCFPPEEELRKQIRAGEKIWPWACRCKREANMDSRDLEKLIGMIEMSEDPSIHEIANSALFNSSNDYPTSQEAVDNVKGISIIESLLNNPYSSVRQRALNALNNISDAAENHRKVKTYINQVCEDTVTYPVNSSVQLAGLRLIKHLTITSEYQHMVTNYISEFLHLLTVGSGETKDHILEMLLNFSKNPSMTKDLLIANAPTTLINIFSKKETKETILNALSLFENINYHLKKRARVFTKDKFSKNSLYFLFQQPKVCAKKLCALAAEYNDPEVKEKVERLIRKL
ncbi:PREDICTED: G-protein coupled receptor-associated sorting protein 1-like [Elephantulus edwardii]|uniref:G-protein coupled receptor-associated sorting protein 1-like n=1 Tax=Elephantulus edwardii TaxID=28737 RepID=UPI0003F0E1A4|nr:PREDICTED: G-protein coupled receptor-associated sorting protein 1-like [Elephantulus edwardii]